MLKKKGRMDFPSSPVVKTPGFQCRGAGSIPGRRTKISQVQGAAKKREETWPAASRLELSQLIIALLLGSLTNPLS